MSDPGPIEETIFLGARQFSGQEERDAYLDQKCAGDPALRHRIEDMLKAERNADQFLAGNPLKIDQTIRVTSGANEVVGSMIGPYKLLQQIGEGGCGMVYMAEQEQPIRRRVALKVIKPGMDTRQIIARFEAERQALAMMDHPNIARVLDAGTTEAGRPYFVMELVRGIRITDYCDQNNLPTRERLELFTQVVQAVQHAHQKGIIHRDLKPSNVLVTLHDGVPVPKVIDFGIAKALEQKLTDKTLFTQFEQFIGTPAYTSPEQAEMSGLDIDTRSDIYSLGVLLYELLVGRTPFDAHALVHSGLDEMRRIIREKEPDRPSTRLSTMVQGEISTTAQRRSVSAPQLIHLLRGDLDWIVMKCLEKDRTRRYATATGLAGDIEHYLGNEPVTARPPSQLYRLSKLVRRNKLAFAAGTAVAIALVAGIIVSTWQAVRAHRAEAAAKEEKESAEAVLRFFRDKIMAAGRPEGQMGGLGKDVTLRQALDFAEAQIGKSFTNRPLVEASIRKTLGESYFYLGEPTKMAQQLKQALDLRWRALGADHPQTFSVVDAMGWVGLAQATRTVTEEMVHLRTAKFGPEHAQTIAAMNRLGLAYATAGEIDKAVPLFEACLRLKSRQSETNTEETLTTMRHLANAYSFQRKLDQALPLFREAIALQKASLAPGHELTRMTLANMATTLMQNGKVDEAVAINEDYYQVTAAKWGPEHPSTLISLDELAQSYAAAGKVDQALAILNKVINLQATKLGPDHPDTLISMERLANILFDKGRIEESMRLNEKVFKGRRAKLGLDHPATRLSLRHLQDDYMKMGRFAEAEVVLQECVRTMTNNLTATRHLVTVLLTWAGADPSNPARAQEHVSEGERLMRDYLPRARLHYTNEPAKLEDALSDFAEAIYRIGRFAEAEPLYRELMQRRRDRLGAEHKDTLSSLGRVLADWAWSERDSKSDTVNRARDGERLLRECLAAHLNGTNQTHWRVGDVRSRLGGALVSVVVTDPKLDAASREARLAEAEILLIEGHQSLQERKSMDEQKYKRDALERLVRLYQVWGKPDQLAAWQQKLEAFDQRKAQASSPVPAEQAKE